jgi:hypothetical protein
MMPAVPIAPQTLNARPPTVRARSARRPELGAVDRRVSPRVGSTPRSSWRARVATALRNAKPSLDRSKIDGTPNRCPIFLRSRPSCVSRNPGSPLMTDCFRPLNPSVLSFDGRYGGTRICDHKPQALASPSSNTLGHAMNPRMYPSCTYRECRLNSVRRSTQPCTLGVPDQRMDGSSRYLSDMKLGSFNSCPV